MNFETTNWSLVFRASASATDVRRVALAGLCEAYWYPLYSFVRRRGCDHEDAADLVQTFFVHLIEKHGFDGLTPERGRFRAFLLASFKNFQADARDRAHAQKRGGHLIRIPWDANFLDARYAATATASEDAEHLFARQWALTVIERARQRLRAQYADAGKAHEFEVMLPYLAPEHRQHATAPLARALAITEGAARAMLLRFRRRFGSALRAEVASTVETAQEVESELRFLLSAIEGYDHHVG
jgi:RNA polymerase sigma-70 factor (ECF subfamily)